MANNILSPLLTENSDFLFLYDGTLCNPNGDPDQENKPRMDYDTETNLVTDTRVKRSIRDFLKAEGIEIFVDMEGDTKVSPKEKLKAFLRKFLMDEAKLIAIFDSSEYLTLFNKLKEEEKADIDKIIEKLVNKKPYSEGLNRFLLERLVQSTFTDIRMFGSAFAIDGFTKPFTGAIQLNWGYSLHKVDLVDSATIVTTMNDDSSTFGKDYRVHYSLLAFNGSINKFASQHNGLTVADRNTFRNAIWSSVSARPTRSKMNQYPQLYLEIVYNEGFSNGHFGDLRKYVKTSPVAHVRSIEDVKVDLSALQKIVSENKGKAIKEVFVRSNFTEYTF